MAQFVHTSVSGAKQRTEDPRWISGRWPMAEASLRAKTAIEDRVRAAGFRHWTLLRPATFMENFLPSMAYLFPRGIEGGLVSVIDPETPLSLVAVDDIGRAAAAALTDPERFDGIELELAGDLARRLRGTTETGGHGAGHTHPDGWPPQPHRRSVLLMSGCGQ